MRKPQDLRKILSQNIRKTRTALHISQAKLAEYADISVPHMVDIEYCKTWVSDKTLDRIACALNMEVFELLTPEKKDESNRKNDTVRQTAEFINMKKKQLRKNVGEAMDDLLMGIIKLHKD
ncbi:MAG: helix-turn-helix domain-containing protein [Treponema sp.]|jgi:transcriptional regulator with XRE-family HTH domain|nr:helix-turn-helix domain-containing protein [Treponema sp.]